MSNQNRDGFGQPNLGADFMLSYAPIVSHVVQIINGLKWEHIIINGFLSQRCMGVLVLNFRINRFQILSTKRLRTNNIFCYYFFICWENLWAVAVLFLY